MAERSKALHLSETLFPLFYAVRASPLPSFTIFYWKLIDPIFRGGLGFKSRPEMPIFQQPSAAMPPMSGGLYGGNKWSQGGGELWKVAEHCLNSQFLLWFIRYIKSKEYMSFDIPRVKKIISSLIGRISASLGISTLFKGIGCTQNQSL